MRLAIVGLPALAFLAGGCTPEPEAAVQAIENQSQGPVAATAAWVPSCSMSPTLPIRGVEVADYADSEVNKFLNLALLVSEEFHDDCAADRDMLFLVDITEEDKPFPISTFQTSEALGDFCNRGLRFGPHSINDAYHPGFDKSLVVLSYFNAGIRVADIRDPFRPREIAYFVPKMTDMTHELCNPECNTQIQTNNVEVDDRGYIHAVDRAGTGLHILELTGEAREIAGL